MTARHTGRDALDGAAVLRWAQLCVAELEKHCDEINGLNVFPVPDADTGTNLLATMRSALAAADSGVTGTYEVTAALARGATHGARGNSGIIMSQVLRGLAESAVHGPLTGESLRVALVAAAGLARAAVSEPVEGTIVTVLDCAAAAASDCSPYATAARVAEAAAAAAVAALARTTNQLGALREAGVVDAGARGLLVLLDGLAVIAGGSVPTRPVFAQAAARGLRADRWTARPGHATGGPVRPVPPRFEVMYRVRDTGAERMAALRERLGELGDSVTIVGDGNGVWAAHVHCGDAGAAVAAGLPAGSLEEIKISVLDVSAAAAPEPGSRVVLTLAHGDGAADLFAREGAHVLRTDEPITAAGLLAAIRALPHREVLVLPNGALPAQELVTVGAAARDAHRNVLLLPSASMMQGLAALAVHDPGRIAADDAFAMSEAAASTRWGSLRIARERALTLVGTCTAGDGLGLIGHEVVVIERDALLAGMSLLDRVLGLGGELVTMLVGADAPDGFADKLSAHIERQHPGVEVIAYPGGQHGDLLQLGVE